MHGLGMPSSLAYLLIDDGAVDIVDPGLPGPESERAIGDALALAGLGLGDVRSIVATHLHPDHLGGAERLRARTGAPVVLHATEAAAAQDPPSGVLTPDVVDDWGVPTERRDEVLGLRGLSARIPHADRRVAEGDRVGRWEVLSTPGHTSGSLCLLDADRGRLMTGDELLPTMFAGIGLGGPHVGNPVAEHLASLERLAALGDLEVLPGHGYRFRGLAERATETRAHHQRRTDEVAAVLADEPDGTIYDVARRLSWTQGWDALAGYVLVSALRQTAWHAERVRAG